LRTWVRGSEELRDPGTRDSKKVAPRRHELRVRRELEKEGGRREEKRCEK